MPKTIHIPADPANEELRQIKARQKARKDAGTPAKITLEMIYEQNIDILENQARIENRLTRLEKQARA